MKHFFALPAVLRVATILATASQQSFSVNDDLLAFPQYDVRLGDKWISEKEAQDLLLTEPGTTFTEDQDEDAIGEYQGVRAANDEDGRDGTQSSRKYPTEYEYMVMDGQRWLCTVPLITKDDETTPLNETSTQAEKEKELAAATDRGWELLSGMKDSCVYFVAGWWSYRFCYNKGIKQFHQLPPSRSVPPWPPLEDPGVQGFILGTYSKLVDDDEAPGKGQYASQDVLGKSEDTKHKGNGFGELVQRGESRYLVQHLGGGTVCDLTGRERTVEVQFHCNPSSSDKISLIKETTTCAYLMVIQTPRLCNDVAFLPPQKDRPNSVVCSPILVESEIEVYEKNLARLKAAERQAQMLKAAAAALGEPEMSKAPPLVGDIIVGAHAMIPKGKNIEKSAIIGGGKETFIDTIASSDGRVLSKQDLEKLGLKDPKAIEKLRKELEKIAEGQSWKLNVVDTARGREYRGIIGDEDDDEDDPKKSGRTKKETKPASETKKTDSKKKGGGEQNPVKEEL